MRKERMCSVFDLSSLCDILSVATENKGRFSLHPSENS